MRPAFPTELYLNNGSALEALIHGASTLAGNVEVAGIGRFTDSIVFQPSARLLLDVNGLDPGTGFDQVKVGQSADLSGHLAVTLVLGYQPKPGDTYAVLTAGSVERRLRHVHRHPDPRRPPIRAAVRTDVGDAGGRLPGRNTRSAELQGQRDQPAGGAARQHEEGRALFGLTVKQLQDAIKAFCD